MSTLPNQALSETRGNYVHAEISREAGEQSYDRRAASYNAVLIERRLRGDHEDLTWSAVLGYN
jgi:hypothetical protein